MWGQVGLILHAYLDQRFVDALVEFRSAETEIRRTERHVVADCRHEQLVVRVLEDETNLAPDLAEVLAVQTGPPDLDPTTSGPACHRAEDPVQVQDQRGLAGTVRAEQRDPLPSLDSEVDTEQRLPPIGIGEHQPLDLNRRSTHSPTTLAASAIRIATSGIARPARHCVREAPCVLNFGIRPV
jgi:hypothetical protein